VLIETIRAILNNRRRVKFVLKDIEFIRSALFFNILRLYLTSQADGSIKAWGHSSYGGTGEPAGSGYTKIYSNGYAFAATKTDGSITAWV
jgi:hypothetical protein